MKRNKKLITLILLSLLCLGLAVTGSLAAFTKTNYIKRVVSTKAGNSDLRFSSNYLLPLKENGGIEARQLPLGDVFSLAVTVCNYPQSDMTRFSSSSIPFQLKVALLDSDGSNLSDQTAKSKLKINGTSLSEYNPDNITLTGGHPSMKQFTFTYSGDINDLKNYRLRVQAVPDGSSGVSTLAADFLFSEAQAADINWKGRFYPVDGLPTDTTQLDAFTYEIYGSAVGNLKLGFSSYLELGKYSLQQLGITKDDLYKDNGRTYIEFKVGGEGQPTSYLLQFYRTGPIPDKETWDIVNDYILQPELTTDTTS